MSFRFCQVQYDFNCVPKIGSFHAKDNPSHPFYKSQAYPGPDRDIFFTKLWTARANFFPVTPTMSALLDPKTSFWSIQCIFANI